MEVIYSFLKYIVKPFYIEGKQKPNRNNLIELGILLLVKSILVILWTLTINNWIKLNYNIEKSDIAKANDLNDGLLFFFISMVLLYPIAEEFIFRYFLKAKKWFLVLLIHLLLTISLSIILLSLNYNTIIIKRAILISVIIGINTICYLLYYKKLKNLEFQKYFKSLFPLLFYTSSISFALIHGLNYDVSQNYFIAIPLITPHLISSLTYGFARMKYGLWASIVLHSGSNAIIFILDKGLGV